MLHIGSGSDRFFSLAIIATLALALACFTPVLTGLLYLAGLASLAAYADYVLFPLLAASIIWMVVAYLEWRKDCCQQAA